MIWGSARHLADYKDQLSEPIYAAIEAVRGQDFLQMKDGVYELSDVGVLKVKSPALAMAKDRPLRAHRHVIDVTYLISGEEDIGWVPISDAASIETDRSDKDQYTLTEKPESGESRIHMKAGDFAIFFPHEGHRPDLLSSRQSNVRKAVLKIPC